MTVLAFRDITKSTGHPSGVYETRERMTSRMKQKYNVTGMSCSACSAHVEKAVSKVPGVNSVQVNLLQNSMVVDYDESCDE